MDPLLSSLPVAGLMFRHFHTDLFEPAGAPHVPYVMLHDRRVVSGEELLVSAPAPGRPAWARMARVGAFDAPAEDTPMGSAPMGSAPAESVPAESAPAEFPVLAFDTRGPWQEGYAVRVPVSPAGVATMPDGTHVHVGAGLPPGSDNGGVLGPAVSTTGDAPNPNAGPNDADPVNLNFLAVQNLIAACGANRVNSAQGGTGATDFSDDLGHWTTFYIEYTSASPLQRTFLYPQIAFWQSLVNDWGVEVHNACPSTPLPANYPTASPGILGDQFRQLRAWGAQVDQNITDAIKRAAQSLPSLSGLTTFILAVLVAVGVWVFWPILAGVHHAL